MENKEAQKDILKWIRAHHESLSPSQRKVAEFLVQGGINVIHYTITEIAQRVGVNSSTVVRTAQSLGFDGFPELQSMLRRHFLSQAKVAQRMQVGSQHLIESLGEAKHGEGHVFNQILRDELQSLVDLPHHVPSPLFDRAVDMMDRANHIYIIGLGASFPSALNFSIFLRYIRPNTTILTPGIDPIPAQLIALTEGDLVFSICFARYTRETLTVMDVARQRKASIITVTDTHVSPAAKRSDVALVIPYRLKMYGNSVALFALMDSLLGALSLRYPETTRQRLETLEELYEQFNLLSKPDE